MSIRIGILGYGNLGRGVECAVEENPDMELVAVFTRRDPSSVKIWSQGVPVVNVEELRSRIPARLEVTKTKSGGSTAHFELGTAES